MIKGYLLTFVWLLLSCQVKAQLPVSFLSEYIDFSIDTSSFSINGIYTFSNNTDTQINKKILFPFAVKSAFIDSIRIIDLNTMRIVPFRKEEQHIVFTLFLLPYDTVEINLFYRQKVASTNTYILTSTKTWNKPLNKAVYTLTVDQRITINSFSYAPDSCRKELPNTTCYWNKFNFSPQLDFDIVIDSGR